MIHSDMRPTLRDLIADGWIYIVAGIVYLVALVTGFVVVCKK